MPVTTLLSAAAPGRYVRIGVVAHADPARAPRQIADIPGRVRVVATWERIPADPADPAHIRAAAAAALAAAATLAAEADTATRAAEAAAETAAAAWSAAVEAGAVEGPDPATALPAPASGAGYSAWHGSTVVARMVRDARQIGLPLRVGGAK